MPFKLDLPFWEARGWKVKIFDKEGPEEPHVNVIRKKTWWRLSLRSETFLDATPDPKRVPTELVEEILIRVATLKAEWNKLHPRNPC